MITEDKILEVLVKELKNSGVRKYTCINGFGYSQLERNIASNIMELIKEELKPRKGMFTNKPIEKTLGMPEDGSKGYEWIS